MPRTYKLTPHEQVTVRRETPEVLDVEVAYEPAAAPPPKHFHPAQDEHFEVLSGDLTVAIDGETRKLHASETLDIPQGTVHQMWAADGPVRAVWQTKPAGRTAQWFRELDALQREGRVGKDGMPGPLAFGVYLTEYRDVMRLAVGPAPVVRAALGLLGAIGRLRGYRTA